MEYIQKEIYLPVAFHVYITNATPVSKSIPKLISCYIFW